MRLQIGGAAIPMATDIAFTLGVLAMFDSPAEAAMLNQAKLGIVAGSFIAGVAGYILLRLSLRGAKKMCSDSHEGLH